MWGWPIPSPLKHNDIAKGVSKVGTCAHACMHVAVLFLTAKPWYYFVVVNGTTTAS